MSSALFIFQDLRKVANDELNVQLDIFEEHREDDHNEFSHRLTDIQVNFEYLLRKPFYLANFSCLYLKFTCLVIASVYNIKAMLSPLKALDCVGI